MLPNECGEIETGSLTPDGIAVLQAWMSSQGLQIMLSVDVWKDTATWGIFLADLARHVSDAYEKAHGLPNADTLNQVLDIFHAEIERPTDSTKGHLHRTH